MVSAECETLWIFLASPDGRVYNETMHILANLGSPAHWFILAVLCLIIFGAKRLPDVARNLGKSMGILRKARREFEEELLNTQTQASTAAQTPAPAPTATPAAQPDELKAQADAGQQSPPPQA